MGKTFPVRRALHPHGARPAASLSRDHLSFRHEAFSFFSHLAGAAAAVVALVLLILRAEGPTAITAFAVYGTTMIAMFTTSALHHVTRAREGFFRRLDMSAIYLFIAGTYTPVCLLAVPLAWGLPMLAAVWAIAVVGVVVRWTLPATPRWVAAGIYLGMGWMAIVGLYPLMTQRAWQPILLLLLGGIVYSIGAVIYARRRPDPWPRYVGHHGIWHVFVLGGVGLHFVIVWGLA